MHDRQSHTPRHAHRRTIPRGELSIMFWFFVLTQSTLRPSPNCTVYRMCSHAFTPSHSEDAVEHDELDIFLRLNEEWDDEIDGTPLAPSIPVGVPGAATPSQITGQRPSFAPNGPAPLQK